MGVTAGATLSFLVAAVANFLVSSRYVFGGGGGARKAVLFLVFAGVGLVINVTATTLIWQASDLPLILCKTGGVGIAFRFNFAVNYLIVFRSRPAHRCNDMLRFSQELSPTRRSEEHTTECK